MILIDTSAWIHFFRRHGNPEAKHRVATALNDDTAAYTCPVLFELLVGARLEREIELVRDTLELCVRMPFEESDWTKAAHLERALRRHGTIVPRDDILIAAVACDRKVPLLCCDRHFDLIRLKGDATLTVQQV
jgi:predicted nucleic acid-binding protein